MNVPPKIERIFDIYHQFLGSGKASMNNLGDSKFIRGRKLPGKVEARKEPNFKERWD